RPSGVEIPAANLADDRHVVGLQTDHVEVRLHHVLEGRPHRSQRATDVLESLDRLRAQVAAADDLAAFVDADLPRDVDGLTRPRGNHVGPARRGAECRWVHELSRHVPPSTQSGPYTRTATQRSRTRARSYSMTQTPSGPGAEAGRLPGSLGPRIMPSGPGRRA